MRPFPTGASGAWQSASPRSLPGTIDKTAFGFDRLGGRGPPHPALGRAIQKSQRTIAALGPHKENNISSPRSPDRESQKLRYVAAGPPGGAGGVFSPAGEKFPGGGLCVGG